GQVTGVYELTLSGDVARADAGRAECSAFLAAGDAAGRGGYAEAVGLYGDLRRAYPDTALTSFVDADLRRTYDEWGTQLRDTGNYDEAVRVYRDLLVEVGDGPEAAGVRAQIAATYVEEADALRVQLATLTDQPRVDAVRSAVENLVAVQREFADTPSAPAAVQGLIDVYAAANTQAATGLWCEALPVLDYLVAVTDAEAAGIVAAADVDRPAALFRCGLQEYDAGTWTESAAAFDQLVAEYPNDPQFAQARADAIAARAAGVQGAALPALPGPFAGDSPGSIPLTLYNDNPSEVRVYVVGPTAHEIVLPGCAGCPATYATDGEACPTFDGRPSARLTLPAGSYTIISQYTGTNPAVQTSAVERGFEYTNCIYVGPDQ
ncbi:tetratricopeptide repeat protein, partial [Pseudonocardia abyssalis]